eukprot:1470536-Prymnesium_polylepis.1
MRLYSEHSPDALCTPTVHLGAYALSRSLTCVWCVRVWQRAARRALRRAAGSTSCSASATTRCVRRHEQSSELKRAVGPFSVTEPPPQSPNIGRYALDHTHGTFTCPALTPHRRVRACAVSSSKPSPVVSRTVDPSIAPREQWGGPPSRAMPRASPPLAVQSAPQSARSLHEGAWQPSMAATPARPPPL